MKKLAQYKLFTREESGLAAVEFALIMPTLFFLMFGAFMLFETARASNKVYLATQTVADLSTRINEMEAGRVSAMYTAGEAILGQYGQGDDVHFGIASINNRLGDNSNRLRVVWGVGTHNRVRIRNRHIRNLDLPDIPDGESVIVTTAYVKVSTPYNIGERIMRGLTRTENTFSETVVRRPRFVSEVCYVRRNGRKLCGNPQGS